MTYRHAAYLSLALLLAVSTYSSYQLGKGRLSPDVRFTLALNLIGVGGLWLRSNHVIEGTVLIVLSRRHGVTAADLLVALPWSLALAVLILGDAGLISWWRARLKPAAGSGRAPAPR